MFLLSRFAVDPHLAFTVGFGLAVLARFFVDRHFVFQATTGAVAGQFPRYVAACLFHYGISAGFFALFLDIFGWRQSVAFVMAVGLSTIASYIAINFALTGRLRTQA